MADQLDVAWNLSEMNLKEALANRKVFLWRVKNALFGLRRTNP